MSKGKKGRTREKGKENEKKNDVYQARTSFYQKRDEQNTNQREPGML